MLQSLPAQYQYPWVNQSMRVPATTSITYGRGYPTKTIKGHINGREVPTNPSRLHNLSGNIDKLSGNLLRMGGPIPRKRSRDILMGGWFPRTHQGWIICPEILISCLEILISCPDLLITSF